MTKAFLTARSHIIFAIKVFSGGGKESPTCCSFDLFQRMNQSPSEEVSWYLSMYIVAH